MGVLKLSFVKGKVNIFFLWKISLFLRLFEVIDYCMYMLCFRFLVLLEGELVLLEDEKFIDIVSRFVFSFFL